MKSSLRTLTSRIVRESLTGVTLVAVIASSSIAHADSATLIDAFASEVESDVEASEENVWSADPKRASNAVAPSALFSSALGSAMAPLAAVTTTSTSPAQAAVTPSRGEGDEGAGLRAAGYLAGGVGIAGIALFLVAGLGAKNVFDKLDSDCSASPCNDIDHRSDIEEGRMLQTAANIGLATGILGVGLGATFIVLGRRPLDDKPTEKSGVALSVGGAPGAISVRGTF